MNDVFTKRGYLNALTHTNTHTSTYTWREYHIKVKGWRDASTSHGTPKIASNPLEARE